MVRNSYGLTLPFALILTFIFSALVSVSYLFVSVNISQMQSSLHELQSISLAEGINEKIKARLNTKLKIQVSPEQEERLKMSGDDEELEDDEEDFLEEDDFDETTEDFDEYYADEVLKISRLITFREPPEESDEETVPQESPNLMPEANVEMIGSINIPQGTVLNRGAMIAIYKDEKISLKLEDIIPEKQVIFKQKLPAPIVKSLTPNYSEPNKKGGFAIIGENLSYDQKARFNTKEINIEDIKSGPSVEYLTSANIMTGLVKFYWENTPAEFYIVPNYDGSPKPIINQVKLSNDNDFLDVKADQRRVLIMIYGIDLFLKKSPPVVIADAVGITPKVKDFSPSGNEVTISLAIDKKVESGTYSFTVATEGGFSNFWLFNVLPPDKKDEDFSANFATVTSSATLLNIMVVNDLLPLIDEGEEEEQQQVKEKSKKNKNPEEEPIEEEDEDIPERKKLGKFSNTDLETEWLLETTVMIGKITRTISEVVQRQIPNISAGVITNGEINFDGGGYQVIGVSTAMTKLKEPTYISNTVLSVEGVPKEEQKEGKNKGTSEAMAQGTPEVNQQQTGSTYEKPLSPIELGFLPGSFVAVYKETDRINDLDYSIIRNVGEDTIELALPGLMDFHYEGDSVFQFIPPVISKSKIPEEEAQKHTVPRDLSINIPSYANAPNIFRSNLKQYAELADLYTNDLSVPSDEYGSPIGFMGLSYIEGTVVFDNTNVLSGKGILIIDTRSDNQGRPIGEVEISGDSRNPATFAGIVYVHGNLKIDGNVTIIGGLIVDNESDGKIQVSSNSLGRIIWDSAAIRQSLLYTPFTTRPGTVMITNKPIDLTGYVQSGTGGETPATGNVTPEATKEKELPAEETFVETIKESEKSPKTDQGPIRPEKKSTEEELIDLF